jgi:fructose-1,6-bisphosphatase/sedoheptulose 1,7-bisphosphatase-like protein
VVFGERDEAPMLFIGEKSAQATVPVLISRWVHLQVQHSQQETCLLL